MIIRSLNITEFGGVKELSLSFSDSLNIIMGNNESGKSTVMLFIVYIFYGLPTKRSGTAAIDKARSVSRDGGKAQGWLDLEADGKLYRISRSLRGRGSVFSVTELETGENIECESPAKLFLSGVSRETFESCCFCGQQRCGGINAEQVGAALSNLSANADEGIDAARVLSLIREARKEYKHELGNGGLIYKVGEQIAELEHKRFSTEKLLDELDADAQRLESFERQRQDAAERLERAEKKKARAVTMRVLADFNSLADTRARIKEEESALSALVESSGLGGVIPKENEFFEIQRLLGDYRERLSELERKRTANERLRGARIDMGAKEKAERIAANGGKEEYLRSVSDKLRGARTLFVAAGISALISLITAAAGLLAGGAILAIMLVLSAAGLSSAAVCAVLGAKAVRELDSELASLGTDKRSYAAFIENCFAQLEIYLAERERIEHYAKEEELALSRLESVRAQMREKLSAYGRYSAEADEQKALEGLARDIKIFSERYKNKERELALQRALAAKQALALEGYDEEEIRGSVSEEPDTLGIDTRVAEEEYASASEELKSLTLCVTKLQIKLGSVGVSHQTLSEIDSELEELLEQRKKYTERYEIYDMAYKAVASAKENLHKAFAPDVRRRAGEIIDRASDGRYSGIYLSSAFDVDVSCGDSPLAASMLSAGTADMIYIAIRIALIEKIFDAPVPLFLDETLSHLDDARASRVLELISELASQNGQALLFTCHSREAALCESLGLAHSLITIKEKE